jgi:fucokinase
MNPPPNLPWDYLIVTASNDAQARAYESQLALRHQLGALPNVRSVLVVADPEGKRVGSGGSTLCCLMEVVNRELGVVGQASRLSPSSQNQLVRDRRDAYPTAKDILRKLRILIIHAGGDSRRLPAYGPCGKIFIPVPGQGSPELGCTLFDRIAPAFLNLPAGCAGQGQVVMAAGDALILFDPSYVSLAHPGLTALTCPDTPEHASKHGVFCAGTNGQVRLYLQKPGVTEQIQLGAVNAAGRTLLDIGVMSFDSTLAMALLRAYGITPGTDGQLVWAADLKQEVLARGVDFYREICCAMGSEASAAHHFQQARSAGCSWDEQAMGKIFTALSGVPFHLETIAEARFLHFGTTRQLITSGITLRQHDQLPTISDTPLCLDSQLRPGAEISATKAWIEGCRIAAPLRLVGNNVVIGVEVDQPLSLPENACLDVLSGQNRAGQPVWFVRAYGIGDTFKDPVAKGGTFCGRPLLDWMAAVGAELADLWDSTLPTEQCSLWDARVIPAEAKADGYRNWLWMFDPTLATREQKQSFLAADRYSAADIAVLADQEAFFAHRQKLRRRETCARNAPAQSM